MLFDGAENMPVAEMSPWLDLRVPPKEMKLAALEAQTHRRFVKTHLPVDALVFSPRAKYIYIGRDGRDVAWSMYNHHTNANDVWYDALNDTPGRVGPPIERTNLEVGALFPRTGWRRTASPSGRSGKMCEAGGRSANLPNVKFVHFANLKADLPGEMRKIAEFLDVPIDDAKWPDDRRTIAASNT